MQVVDQNDKIRIHNEKVLAKLVSTIPTDSRFINLTGQVFERMTVVSYAGQYQRNAKIKYWWCQCECGSPEKLVEGGNLRNGYTISCGCHRSKITSERSTTHGLSNDPWYKIADGQQRRMTNPNHPQYADYGGRGLKFGEGMETIEERILFYQEFFGPAPPEGMQVDRIDNDKGYAKDNVRLATPKENMENTRISHGHYRTPTYRACLRMKKNYKGEICERWAGPRDFKNFLEDMGEKPEKSQLKRINTLLPYSKDNCYWKTFIKETV